MHPAGGILPRPTTIRHHSRAPGPPPGNIFRLASRCRRLPLLRPSLPLPQACHLEIFSTPPRGPPLVPQSRQQPVNPQEERWCGRHLRSESTPTQSPPTMVICRRLFPSVTSTPPHPQSSILPHLRFLPHTQRRARCLRRAPRGTLRLQRSHLRDARRQGASSSSSSSGSQQPLRMREETSHSNLPAACRGFRRRPTPPGGTICPRCLCTAHRRSVRRRTSAVRPQRQPPSRHSTVESTVTAWAPPVAAPLVAASMTPFPRRLQSAGVEAERPRRGQLSAAARCRLCPTRARAAEMVAAII